MNVRSSNMRVIQKIGRTVSRKSEVPNWKLTEWTWSWFAQMAVLVRACNVHTPFHFQVRPFRNILLLHSVDIGVVRICIDAGILPQEIFTQPLTIPLSICDKNVGGITWLQARLPERKNGPGGYKIHWFVRVTCSRLLRQTLRCFWNKYDGWCSVRCVKKIYWSQRCDRCRPNGQIGGQSNSLSPRDVLVRAGYKRNLRPVSRNKVSVSLLCSRRGHLANDVQSCDGGTWNLLEISRAKQVPSVRTASSDWQGRLWQVVWSNWLSSDDFDVRRWYLAELFKKLPLDGSGKIVPGHATN